MHPLRAGGHSALQPYIYIDESSLLYLHYVSFFNVLYRKEFVSQVKAKL
jgi:hypothetical protein